MNSHAQKKRNIIWDLSGTLFKPSSAGLSIQELADYSLVFYMWSGKTEPSKLDTYALKLIDQAAEPSSKYQSIRTHTGSPVPTLICMLLAGLISSEDAYKKVMQALQNKEQNTQHNLNSTEIAQAHRIIKAFFDPLVLARCMKPIKISTELVIQCSQNPLNTLYVISNWDAQSYAYLLQTYAGEAPLSYIPFNNILISADSGFIKPQAEIYDFFLAKYKLDPNTCFFIDDQKENIEGAQTRDIDGIQFKINDSVKLTRILKALNIIL